MEKAKVYYTDFRTIAFGDGLPTKLKKLIQKAGIGQIDMDGKFVAIKMHFGEQGNISFLRPNYARAVVDVVKELGGKPFLTDCNTMYPGSRKNAIEHLYCAWENGFTPLTVGCPVIIGDGLKGTDDIGVPVAGGEYVKEARIGRAIMDADVFISLTHFKGHESTGFGGALKNIGMGCGSRAGKMEQHAAGKPAVQEGLCRGCHRCAKECGSDAITYNAENKAVIDYDKCRVCKNGACPNRFTPKGKPDRVAALCNRTCLCHLEAEDRTENRFEQAFRKRDAWALNASGSYAERNPDVANVLGGVFSKDGNRGAK